eukprot:SAG31_NODE_27161_length_430_cov_1.078550_1_plen_32_part_01
MIHKLKVVLLNLLPGMLYLGKLNLESGENTWF